MALIGDVDSLALTDLVQVSALSRRDCAIHLAGVARGKLVFSAGELVHAEYGELEGNDAVYAVLAEPGITFSMEHGVPAHRRTVSYGWNELLLQATLRVDEDRVPRPQAQAPSAAATATPRRRAPFFVGTALLALVGVGVVAVGLSPRARLARRALVAPTPRVPMPAVPAAPPPAPEMMRVFFDPSSTYLHVSEHRLLIEVANQLRQPGTRARIVGHADGGSGLVADVKLARERADRVADFLLRAGASPDAVAVDIAPAGDGRPGDGASGRRVDVLLLRAR